jgi:hydroxypyruvate reductase
VALHSPSWTNLHADLVALHAAALAAADPEAAVRRALAIEGDEVNLAGERVRLTASSRISLVAAGKASRRMAAAAVDVLRERLSGGVVVHPYDPPDSPGAPPPRRDGLLRIAASHPVPDENSLRAGAEALHLVEGSRPDDLLLVLLSGGASSLLESLRPPFSLPELRRITAALQRAGADVVELNIVRRAVSRIKGGGLARAASPARVATLALSDVLGDLPEAIGSGPTVDSPTGAAEAMHVLERFGVASIVPTFEAGRGAPFGEGDAAAPAPAIHRIVASNRQAAEAVARAASERGFDARLMTTFLQGEAREVGRALGGFAVGAATTGIPAGAPACLIFGGETTVTVTGKGRGGRNHELALGAAQVLAGTPRAAILSFATDGVDGSSDAAGALATGDTLARASALGLSAHRALADSDSDAFFRALGDQFTSGPTGTNVNDLVIALVYP